MFRKKGKGEECPKFATKTQKPKKRMFVPNICRDQNNWVGPETIWERTLIIINIENDSVEEMAVRSNDKFEAIKLSYVRQANVSVDTRLFFVAENRTTVELKGVRELWEYPLGDKDPIYASTVLGDGETLF